MLLQHLSSIYLTRLEGTVELSKGALEGAIAENNSISNIDIVRSVLSSWTGKAAAQR